ITATLNGYQFNSIQIARAENDLINQYLIGKATATFFSISGFVKDTDGQPMVDMEISGLPQLVRTNTQGFFTVSLQSGWSGALTPVSDKYTFNPSTLTVSNLSRTLIDQNFIGTIITSIEDNQDATLQIFPNPSTDGIVNLVTSISSETQIMDSTGKLVYAFISNGQFSERIKLSQGFYIITTKNSGSSDTRKKKLVVW
ncbi:MAG: T9SS type A sorting domain-containing protein, partial [Cyclobacteriaceae bacterium]|nr:T9SS type A sorting domain-containing protein [Cyclobacteriaceae bacterium]